jgi:hypothetical protein
LVYYYFFNLRKKHKENKLDRIKKLYMCGQTDEKLQRKNERRAKEKKIR